jgi:DNA-binding IclR family transcriptional regulator
MELDYEEEQLLRHLADEWQNSGPPGYLETGDLAKRLNLTVGKTKSIIHTLFVKGLVGTDEKEHYAAYLTPEGYASVEI